jgi:hypothetical protein
VWFDELTGLHDTWADTTRDRVDGCSAFVVVMTPAADDSPYVAREILRAQAGARLVVPLRLDGEALPVLATSLAEDVRGGLMPQPTLVDRLRTLVTGDPSSATVGPDPGLGVTDEDVSGHGAAKHVTCIESYY